MFAYTKILTKGIASCQLTKIGKNLLIVAVINARIVVLKKDNNK